jgi:branched-chain amino acid transport system ATP-binding protein
MTVEEMLVIDGVTVNFGGNQVLSDVAIDVRTGQVSGLIGPNGAGKTTLFNVVTGVLVPRSGRVLLEGRDLGRMGTHERARLGIARTFQRLELFTDLSVRDNLRVACEIRNTWHAPWSRGFRRNPTLETERMLDLVGLRRVAEMNVAAVATGTARLVELGRALMMRPRVLLLDEPASGQTEEETKAFGALLTRLAREDGLTILLVEHDMNLVMDVCDRIHVLDFGQVIAAGPPAEVRANPAVLDAYLGAPS